MMRQACSALATTVILCGVIFSGAVSAAPAIIFSLPDYQSPVRGDPDDLLFLPGYGFSSGDTAVYQSLADTTRLPGPPDSIPSETTALSGVAEVVSAAEAPHSLTLRLPRVMRQDQSYVIRVRNSAGEWSNGVRINDARPVWLSPGHVYATAALANLPRYLKVVGRNLQPASGQITRIRLTGPETIVLAAADDHDPATAVERYAAIAALPEALPVGKYHVEVNRDGVSWVRLADQQLTVNPDPPALTQFPVGRYGCRADDAEDDAPCVVRAIAAAAAAGGGAVLFGPGAWKLSSAAVGAGIDFVDGIIVPPGINLLGAGMGVTVIERAEGWSAWSSKAEATLTLQGGNTVSGFTFRDAHRYRPADAAGVMLRLGKTRYRVNPRDPDEPKIVSDVVITGNGFDKPHTAIGDGGLPITQLFVTYNEFGAYSLGINAGGDRYDTAQGFHLDDSVIAYNVFKPGSHVDAASGQGAMASVIGAARRLDFSHNIADGTATDYLYAPDDAKGWRAAFFWHLNNNQEMLLVSRNTVTCSGDKAGDGEAIAYDNNANTFAFDGARGILAASADTVTVDGPLIAVQNTKAVGDRLPAYYKEHWVQIAQGPGLGQIRRISAYRIEPGTGQMTFTVTPAWEVLPQARSSRLTVAHQFWQVYTVDNLSDQRTPPCRKSNANGPRGGSIALWAQTADSAVEGNRLYDGSGISLQQAYSAAGAACGISGCEAWTSMLAFVEIRGNTIEGEYDWSSDCSLSGIYGSHAASPTPHSPPPVAGYGVSIAHNAIDHADGLRGGAITLPVSWHSGPPPSRWKLISNILIHHNSITNLLNPAPARRCDTPQTSRIGINIHDRLVWHTVLYRNTCSRVGKPLNDLGTGTIRVCPADAPADSCECADAAAVDLSLKVTAAKEASSRKDSIAYTARISNPGADRANGIALSIDPSAGIRIEPGSFVLNQGDCEPASGICDVGGLPGGSVATISFRGIPEGPGGYSMTFSVTHNGPDPDMANNGMTVVTRVRSAAPHQSTN